jgi:hypothetical protein
MQTLLERLDIHPKVQSFFKPFLIQTCDNIIFKQDTYFEHVSERFHRIPITEAVWMAGETDIATDFFICGSAMDAIAWLDLNHKHYRRLENLCFISSGSVPNKSHAETIQKHTPQKKLHFIYSKDDLGALCDLKLASFIRDKPLTTSYHENGYIINFENKIYTLNRLSLNALEKASRYNFHIRTHKPKNTSNYYEQHRNRHPT